MDVDPEAVRILLTLRELVAQATEAAGLQLQALGYEVVAPLLLVQSPRLTLRRRSDQRTEDAAVDPRGTRIP